MDKRRTVVSKKESTLFGASLQRTHIISLSNARAQILSAIFFCYYL